MNKNFILLLFVIIAFSGLGNFALAADNDNIITLPNPLCPQGSTIPNPNPPPATIPNPSCIHDFPSLINQITTYITTLIGALAVIMFIWAGILFVTAAGNESKIGTAKKAVWWGIIGVAIAIAGKGLVAVVTNIIGTPP